MIFFAIDFDAKYRRRVANTCLKFVQLISPESLRLPATFRISMGQGHTYLGHIPTLRRRRPAPCTAVNSFHLHFKCLAKMDRELRYKLTIRRLAISLFREPSGGQNNILSPQAAATITQASRRMLAAYREYRAAPSSAAAFRAMPRSCIAAVVAKAITLAMFVITRRGR